jgi:hypothetical protein
MDFERIADEGDEEHEFERVEDSFDFEIVDDEEDEDQWHIQDPSSGGAKKLREKNFANSISFVLSKLLLF